MADRSHVNEPDRVVTVVVVSDKLVALTRDGKLFERLPDARDFAQGPNHRPGHVWRQIAGPLDEAGG